MRHKGRGGEKAGDLSNDECKMIKKIESERDNLLKFSINHIEITIRQKSIYLLFRILMINFVQNESTE